MVSKADDQTVRLVINVPTTTWRRLRDEAEVNRAPSGRPSVAHVVERALVEKFSGEPAPQDKSARDRVTGR